MWSANLLTWASLGLVSLAWGDRGDCVNHRGHLKSTQTLSAIEELRLPLAKQHTKFFHLVVGGLVGAAVVLLCKIVDGQYKDCN